MVTKYQVKDALKTDKQKIDKDLENIQRFISQPGLVIAEDTLGFINDQVKAMKDYSKALGNLIEGINTSGYTKAEVKGKVIVKYLDTDSKEIDKQDIITGEIGADYSVTAKSISGYTLKTDATNKKGKFTEDDITVTFTYTKDTVKVTGVTIAPESISVNIGKTTQLTSTITPANADNKKVTYTSSDENIATVDNNGLVTGIAKGGVDITVTTEDGGKTAVSAVTVTEPNVAVDGVAITPDSVSVAIGATTQLSGSVTPSNATNKKITYTSSDETIATVDETGKVTGKKAGEVEITGTSEDGAKTAKSKITVTEA